ncbi:hydroxypyruvate isomerase family protein [Silvibacterium acidisoli]|uniref:hydroxypyruvate isomerase family protein n=1 Tax=Acidobacteriaceae bacterium ZG23-2 TaxID=2883246 RepID=UPI00406C3E85
MNRRHFHKLAAGAALAYAARNAWSLPAAAGPKFSVMLWTLTGKTSFDNALKIVADAGYQGIELTGQFQKWSDSETQQFLKRIQSLNLLVDSMSGLRAGFCVPSESDVFLKQFQEHIDYAVKLHCPQVILLSGKRDASMSVDQQKQVSVENLLKASDIAAKHDIEIVIEPIDPLENPTIFLQTVTDGFSIARAVNRPNVKVLYDFYHEQRAFGNLIEKLDKNIDLIGLVHIADVPGRNDPGTGEVDYNNIYRKLASLHYKRYIAMEFYPTTEPVAALKKARLDAEKAFATNA